jgi:hypothetical protein
MDEPFHVDDEVNRREAKRVLDAFRAEAGPLAGGATFAWRAVVEEGKVGEKREKAK